MRFHVLGIEEREMSIGRSCRIVIWQSSEEEFREQASKRTVLSIILTILVSPGSKIEGCKSVSACNCNRDELNDLRVKSTVIKRSPRVRQTASAKMALEMVYPGHKPAPGTGSLVSSACRPTCYRRDRSVTETHGEGKKPPYMQLKVVDIFVERRCCFLEQCKILLSMQGKFEKTYMDFGIGIPFLECFVR